MCQKHLFISLASLFCEVVHLLLVAFKPRKWSAFGTKNRILTITHGNQGDALLLLERERERVACMLTQTTGKWVSEFKTILQIGWFHFASTGGMHEG
jgi:hypothetical protein